MRDLSFAAVIVFSMPFLEQSTLEIEGNFYNASVQQVKIRTAQHHAAGFIIPGAPRLPPVEFVLCDFDEERFVIKAGVKFQLDDSLKSSIE